MEAVVAVFIFIFFLSMIFGETEEDKKKEAEKQMIAEQRIREAQLLAKQKIADQKRIESQRIIEAQRLAEQKIADQKRIEAQKRRSELEQLANQKIYSWRQSLEIGDYCSYGLIIGIKDDVVAQIQTSNSVKWYRIDEIYPVGKIAGSVENFLKILKDDYLLNYGIKYLEQSYENAFGSL